MIRKGLLDQIRGSNTTYAPLTMSKLKSLIADVVYPKNNEITLYTGIVGYFIYKLHLAGIRGSIEFSYWITDFKRLYGVLYISVYKKHGEFKIIANLKGGKDKLTFMQGTRVIGTSNNLNDCSKYFI